MDTMPVSAVIPTVNRTRSLRETLASLEKQGVFPAELIVVDASDDAATRDMLNASGLEGRVSRVRWIPAHRRGAAAQRNQGVAASTQPTIWFFDDDILFEPDCMRRLWRALHSDPKIGGVNAMIVNQRYHPPGVASRIVFRFLHDRREQSYAGKIIGPAVNLLPEDRDDLPEVVPVDWLNTTCTFYRREALPSPPFDSIFTGYSLMEDVSVSIRVGKKWKLANARTARIYHNSQPADYKAHGVALAKMELINRHYVMTQILGRDRASDYLRLLAWEIFQLAVCGVRSADRSNLSAIWRGKWRAWREICSKKAA